MLMGVSFNRGVFYHDRTYLSCAEIRDGVIHVWAEKISLKTIGKIWVRVVLTLPWYYHVFHAAFLYLLLFSPWLDWLNPFWAIVYVAGFHFVFPRQLKKFHGAEHKVFSYAGEKRLEALEQIGKANIVNDGCSTNIVVCFFLPFLLTLPFAPLEWSVLAGAMGSLAGLYLDRYLRKYAKPVYRLSAFLQRYVTCKQPDRKHLETAIRSYELLQHVRSQ